MVEPVKPKRVYRSKLRSTQAADTRGAVLSAASEIFVQQGWQKATIAAIAQKAGVAVETVYASFGNKRALLEAVIVTVVRGANPQTPLMDQAGPRAVLEAADPREQLALFAQDICAVLQRVAPIMAVVRAAAESDPKMAELYSGLHRGRARNLGQLIDALAQRGHLRTDRDTALATVARLASPELFLLATRVQGQSPAQYQAWLADVLQAVLLPIGA